MSAQPDARLEERIRAAVNSASAENASNTPDFILASYLIACLDAFNAATNARAKWYDPDAPEVMP
jgi:hypothetical protein